jgi:hypothetical protein
MVRNRPSLLAFVSISFAIAGTDRAPAQARSEATKQSERLAQAALDCSSALRASQ